MADGMLKTHADSEHAQAVTFDLSGETFALDAGLVREVLDLCAEASVPGAAPFVSAVINFRGRVIPLADLRLPFGLVQRDATRASRIIVIEYELDGEMVLIGLRADKVYEVAAVDPAQSEPLPSLGTRWQKDFVTRLVRRAGDVLVMPDLGAIFAAQGGGIERGEV